MTKLPDLTVCNTYHQECMRMEAQHSGLQTWKGEMEICDRNAGEWRSMYNAQLEGMDMMRRMKE